MTYEGNIYRPPSEADAFILQATIGCSHNLCLYCDMYREKKFRVRKLKDTLRILEKNGRVWGKRLDKLFVADGDALVMDMDHWISILDKANETFPHLKRISCYATAINVLEKTEEELKTLRQKGLKLLYIGPESGDPETLKRLVKGATYEEHVEAAERAHAAGMEISSIALIGAGGVERSQEHAEATARLTTDMDPEYFAALTLTVIPGTPMAKLQDKGGFVLPDKRGLLQELRTMIDQARPTNALFRTNHASNYLPLRGRLPQDRDKLLTMIDAALDGDISLRPEWSRGL